MVEPGSEFNALETYDSAAHDYEDASRDYWRFVSLRCIDRLRLAPGDRVVDVPCGTGPSLITAAEAVGPAGRVLGIDYAPQMVAIARERVHRSGLDTIEVEVGDMLALRPSDPGFDALACPLGVFFVPDMHALVRSFAALVHPRTGRLVLGVFGSSFFEPMRSVFVDAVGEVAPEVEVIEPWRRTADEAVLRDLFTGADIAELTITTDEDRLPLPAPSDWWRIVMGSGLRRTVDVIGDAAASEVRERCESYIAARNVTEVLTTTRYALAHRTAR